jgi:glycyl-tRNA synthetase beta chain
MPDLLLEIGVEEIPARMIDDAREELRTRVADLLVRERLIESGNASISAFSTPRRIAVIANSVAAAQSDVTEQMLGPSVKVAFKDGNVMPPAEAFARKAGVDVAKLIRVSNPKGEYIAADVTRKGAAASAVLAEALPKEIAGIHWQKTMYWRGKNSVRFVRPVRWLVAMVGKEIVPFEFGGQHTGSSSRGHRLLGNGSVEVDAANYGSQLAQAGVVADPAERTSKIAEALRAALRALPGARYRRDEALLATVVNLVEAPAVVLGSFDREFLSLPEEILVTVMRDHQKYFAVEDEQGRLLPQFLAVLNNGSDADSLIRHGNERVLRARFNDARFFWQADQKIRLDKRVEMLKAVTFQKDLGSYFEKAQRMSHLVNIGGADFDRPTRKIHRNAVYQAAWLAKTDLTTELVKEFTELQGIVGGLYAKAQGFDDLVAEMIYDHYKPASMDDAVPRSIEGAILALSDKADTIAGMFALGLQPTGSKDPFALRRQANGIVKIVAEHRLPLDLQVLFDVALAAYRGSQAEKKFSKLDSYKQAIAAFFRERLEYYLRDVRGFAYDEVNSVLATDSVHVTDVLDRVKAVSSVRSSSDFESITIAFKRMKNILRQASEKNLQIGQSFDATLSKDEAEKALANATRLLQPKVEEFRKHHQYEEALREIASLRPTLDTFFDKVMVMVDDSVVRANRLSLLQQLLRDFSRIADFSEIVTEKK